MGRLKNDCNNIILHVAMRSKSQKQEEWFVLLKKNAFEIHLPRCLLVTQKEDKIYPDDWNEKFEFALMIHKKTQRLNSH